MKFAVYSHIAKKHVGTFDSFDEACVFMDGLIESTFGCSVWDFRIDEVDDEKNHG